jgi:hypothetical protein
MTQSDYNVAISLQLFFSLNLEFQSFQSFLLTNNFLSLQGAERKTRDEERRAAKRKMTATGRKKLDELYHPVTDRSEFYCMSDIAKPPVLFSPSDDIEKVSKITYKQHIHHDMIIKLLLLNFNSCHKWSYKVSMDMIQTLFLVLMANHHRTYFIQTKRQLQRLSFTIIFHLTWLRE